MKTPLVGMSAMSLLSPEPTFPSHPRHSCQHLITCNFYRGSLNLGLSLSVPANQSQDADISVRAYLIIFAATLHPATARCKEGLLSAEFTNNPYYGSERVFLAWLSSQQQNSRDSWEMRGKKEIQRLCCFRIDDDDDVREMLNINFVFKLSNFDRDVSLTMSNEKGAMKLLDNDWGNSVFYVHRLKVLQSTLIKVKILQPGPVQASKIRNLGPHPYN